MGLELHNKDNRLASFRVKNQVDGYEWLIDAQFEDLADPEDLEEDNEQDQPQSY